MILSFFVFFGFLDSDASHCDLFPESASCKCYFFDNLGKLSPKHDRNDSNNRFNDVLRRRFLRQGFVIILIIIIITFLLFLVVVPCF